MERFLVWLRSISTSPFLPIGSFVLAIFAVVMAIFFYVRSRRSKVPLYTKRSFNIIQDFSTKLSYLTVQYKNETVDNLTITKLAFWNDGRQTINMIDIAEADPLRISAIHNSKILSAEVIYSRNPANRFRISDIEQYTSTKLLFDYLDRNEGGVIQIIHTGKSSKDIEVKGTVKGAGEPVLKYLPSSVTLPLPLPISLQSKFKRRTFGYLMFFSLIVAAAVGVGIILFSKEDKAFGWVLCFTYGIASIAVYFMYIKRRIPKHFEIIEQEL